MQNQVSHRLIATHTTYIAYKSMVSKNNIKNASSPSYIMNPGRQCNSSRTESKQQSEQTIISTKLISTNCLRKLANYKYITG